MERKKTSQKVNAEPIGPMGPVNRRCTQMDADDRSRREVAMCGHKRGGGGTANLRYVAIPLTPPPPTGWGYAAKCRPPCLCTVPVTRARLVGPADRRACLSKQRFAG